MPNWCSGNIRFRGNIDNILKLLNENIIICTYADELNENNQIDTIQSAPRIKTEKIKDEVIEVSIMADNNKSWFYINNTHRNFLNNFDSLIISSDVCKLKDGRYIVTFSDFQAAWGIEAEPYVEMSKKYNVDIHIFGWEQGMEYDQEIEVINGELKKNILNDGDDWKWSTAMPYIGG